MWAIVDSLTWRSEYWMAASISLFGCRGRAIPRAWPSVFTFVNTQAAGRRHRIIREVVRPWLAGADEAKRQRVSAGEIVVVAPRRRVGHC
jgi:hypothetical protein